MDFVVLSCSGWWLSPCSLWGAFFADIALQSLGTDYARIVRAIYTIAQVSQEQHCGSVDPPPLLQGLARAPSIWMT